MFISRRLPPTQLAQACYTAVSRGDAGPRSRLASDQIRSRDHRFCIFKTRVQQKFGDKLRRYRLGIILQSMILKFLSRVRVIPVCSDYR